MIRNYTGGVITGLCGINIDHAVLAVGYDTDTDGTPYFLVKNSWGASWGLDGYLKIAATKYDVCGILGAGSQPQA